MKREVKKKKTRQSGIELLRIIAMLMIVAHHFAQHTVWPAYYEAEFMFNSIWIGWLIEFGKVGVAIFFIITGYFLAAQKKFEWKRIFRLLRPMWFYSAVFLILALALGMEDANFSWPLNMEMVRSLLPATGGGYWFISSYIIVTLISPYLKKALDALKENELLRLLLVLFITLNIPIITSLLSGQMQAAIFTANEAILYTVVGYTIKRNEERIKNKAWPIILMAFSLLFFAVEPILLYLIKQNDPGNFPLDFFWSVTTLPCAAMAVTLFIVFSRLKLQSKIVNYLASLTFGVYLVHDNCWMVQWLWKGKGLIHTVEYMSYGPKWMMICSVLLILIVFFGSMIIEAIRQGYVKLFMFWYNRIKERR